MAKQLSSVNKKKTVGLNSNFNDLNYQENKSVGSPKERLEGAKF